METRLGWAAVTFRPVVGFIAALKDGAFSSVLRNEQVLDVANVIWCTGFRPDFSWIDVPVFDDQDHQKEHVHVRGVVPESPGLYFVGLFFLYALTSSLFTGVGRDGSYVVDHLVARERQPGAKPLRTS